MKCGIGQSGQKGQTNKAPGTKKYQTMLYQLGGKKGGTTPFCPPAPHFLPLSTKWFNFWGHF